MKISKDKVVSIHYTLTNTKGDVIDSSRERGEPLKYIHGHRNLIPGMENGIEGREVAEKLNLEIEPKDGYGEKNEDMIQRVPKAQFGEQDVKPGMMFTAQTQQGPVQVTITDVLENEVVVDANHALAGEKLFFDVEIMEVREATAEELSHGHVH